MQKAGNRFAKSGWLYPLMVDEQNEFSEPGAFGRSGPTSQFTHKILK